MPDFDLILRGGNLVQPTGVWRADLGVSDRKIAAIGEALSGTTGTECDASDLHIFPGVIDAHVHFNEPGRADWEGLETGSKALAAGGATLFFDMPLNAHPPTVDGESFRLKLAAAERNSVVDFALWGGLVPRNLDRLGELAACGVIGFKAFMASSGIDDFECVNDSVLREGMKRAGQLRLPVAVHAESERITRQLTQQCLAQGRTSARDFLDSRPVAAELDAIGRALEMAGETGAALHVVHVSSGRGVALIAEARWRGVDVSCETCPHYLALTEEDVERMGAAAKCAPPLRTGGEQEELWMRLLAGEVTTIGSDHSPSPPEMKLGASFFNIWGGISGAQHTLPILLTDGHFKRNAPLPLLAALLAGNVRERFKLPPSKGAIVEGADADLAMVDLRQSFEVAPADLFYRHRQSPYLGRTLRGKVLRTILRGETIYQNGKIIAKPAVHLVKPVL